MRILLGIDHISRQSWWWWCTIWCSVLDILLIRPKSITHWIGAASSRSVVDTEVSYGVHWMGGWWREGCCLVLGADWRSDADDVNDPQIDPPKQNWPVQPHIWYRPSTGKVSCGVHRVAGWWCDGALGVLFGARLRLAKHCWWWHRPSINPPKQVLHQVDRSIQAHTWHQPSTGKRGIVCAVWLVVLLIWSWGCCLMLGSDWRKRCWWCDRRPIDSPKQVLHQVQQHRRCSRRWQPLAGALLNHHHFVMSDSRQLQKDVDQLKGRVKALEDARSSRQVRD